MQLKFKKLFYTARIQKFLPVNCFICTILEGDLTLLEHESARWLTKETLDSVDWLPADLRLIRKLKEIL